MTEEVKKEEHPANAPWKIGWREVAKASGGDVPEETKPVGVVETVTKAVKPWLMDWGVIAREAKPPPAPKMDMGVAAVPVKTENQMRAAMQGIGPDTSDPAKNIAEIKKEMGLTKDKNILATLQIELDKNTKRMR